MAEAGCRFISGEQCELGNPENCSTVSINVQRGQRDRAQQLGVEIQEVYDYPEGGVEGLYPVVRLCQRALHKPEVIAGVAEMAGTTELDLRESLGFVVLMNQASTREQEINRVLGTETVDFNKDDYPKEGSEN